MRQNQFPEFKKLMTTLLDDMEYVIAHSTGDCSAKLNRMIDEV